MRNIILASLIGLIGLFMIAESSEAAPPLPTQTAAPTLGDVNCDQTVNVVDALSILRHVAGLGNSDGCWALADANCDHQLDTRDALAILRFAAGNSVSNFPCESDSSSSIVELKEGEVFTEKSMKTPQGLVRVTLSASSISGATVSSTYARTCTMRIWDAAGGSLYSLRLQSTFWYNYQTLWQGTPYLTWSSLWPYRWSNQSAWNSSWSYRVKFADGQAVLNSDIPVPGFWSQTKHLYIQEDAWGNCTGRWYAG